MDRVFYNDKKKQFDLNEYIYINIYLLQIYLNIDINYIFKYIITNYHYNFENV